MNENDVLAILSQDIETLPLRADWAAFEAEFGLELPRDYKVLVDGGDPIELFSFVWLLNPFAEDGSFPRENNPMLDFAREDRPEEEWGTEIFAIGGTSNSSELWLTHENGSWHVQVADRHYFEIETFPMSLSEFLIRFIRGEIRPQQFPAELLSRYGWPFQM